MGCDGVGVVTRMCNSLGSGSHRCGPAHVEDAAMTSPTLSETKSKYQLTAGMCMMNRNDGIDNTVKRFFMW